MEKGMTTKKSMSLKEMELKPLDLDKFPHGRTRL